MLLQGQLVREAARQLHGVELLDRARAAASAAAAAKAVRHAAEPVMRKRHEPAQVPHYESRGRAARPQRNPALEGCVAHYTPGELYVHRYVTNNVLHCKHKLQELKYLYELRSKR